MSKIAKVLRMENKGDSAKVFVMMEDGTEGYVYIGGDCEVFLHHGQIKVFIKKGAPK